jgi:hypothetical protein
MFLFIRVSGEEGWEEVLRDETQEVCSASRWFGTGGTRVDQGPRRVAEGLVEKDARKINLPVLLGKPFPATSIGFCHGCVAFRRASVFRSE